VSDIVDVEAAVPLLPVHTALLIILKYATSKCEDKFPVLSTITVDGDESVTSAS
jgi:hypothetical protein